MAKDIKTGGRTKGTPNKLTNDIRTSINDFINNNIDELQINFNHLEPKEKLYFLERLFKYIVPVMSDNSFKSANINSFRVDTIFRTDDNEPIFNLPSNFKGVDKIEIDDDIVFRVNKKT
jgi:hypothetical protein